MKIKGVDKITLAIMEEIEIRHDLIKTLVATRRFPISRAEPVSELLGGTGIFPEGNSGIFNITDRSSQFILDIKDHLFFLFFSLIFLKLRDLELAPTARAPQLLRETDLEPVSPQTDIRPEILPAVEGGPGLLVELIDARRKLFNPGIRHFDRRPDGAFRFHYPVHAVLHNTADI
ncbi:MAG: hypothetical protein BWY49_00063 [Candidatus Omnitrophica bacterium ADurb.Bin314]|nr:MAG: hypothetical protein BWY49_00063 [Candidatus Omnitrophica bacterium ADurb.Bin314]